MNPDTETVAATNKRTWPKRSLRGNSKTPPKPSRSLAGKGFELMEYGEARPVVIDLSSESKRPVSLGGAGLHLVGSGSDMLTKPRMGIAVTVIDDDAADDTGPGSDELAPARRRARPFAPPQGDGGADEGEDETTVVAVVDQGSEGEGERAAPEVLATMGGEAPMNKVFVVVTTEKKAAVIIAPSKEEARKIPPYINGKALITAGQWTEQDAKGCRYKEIGETRRPAGLLVATGGVPIWETLFG